MADVNIGFIKAIHSGTAPPTNIKMVWYNENDNLLYRYDVILSEWIVLDVQPYKYQASQSIPKHRVVYYDESTNKVSLADKDVNASEGDKIVGVSLNDANTNDVVLITDFYMIEDSSWSWDTSKKIFLANNGELTQTVPTQGVLLEIAEAATPTRIRINLRRPIKRISSTPSGNPIVAGSNSIPAPLIMFKTFVGMNAYPLPYVKWNGEYEDMFNQDVKLWMFIQRKTRSHFGSESRIKWVHPPHQSVNNKITGVKYGGGEVARPSGFGQISTEFDVSGLQDRLYHQFNFDVTDWFFSGVDSSNGHRLHINNKYHKVSDGYGDDKSVFRFFGARRHLGMTIAFAFVIRDRAVNGEGYPYIIGQMSQPVKLYWGKLADNAGNQCYSILHTMKSSG